MINRLTPEEQVNLFFEKYTITECAKIINKRTNRVSEGSSLKGGRFVKLYHEGLRYQIGVHRLVATKYVEKPSPDATLVLHIDGNKQNNHASNLRWATQSEMVLDNYNKGKMSHVNTQPVLQYTTDDIFLKEFDSAKNAAKEVKGHSSAILNCCRGTNATAYGFKWRFK